MESSESSTLGEAARKLGISQPALSLSLQRLERDLGHSVFYRSRSGIQLTPTGSEFLVRAKRAVLALKELNLKPDPARIFDGRTIVLGCHSTVAQYCVPSALRFLGERASDYRIELKHDLSRNIQSEIQRGKIDIGVVINPTPNPDLVIKRLGSDRVGIWTSAAVKSGAKLSRVICNPALIQTQSILRKWKNRPIEVLSTDSLDLICKLTEQKIGYGILPHRAVQAAGARLVPVQGLPTFHDEIHLVYRPEFGKAPFERMTIEALKQSVE